MSGVPATRLVAFAAVLMIGGCSIPADPAPRVVPADSVSPPGPSASPEVVRGPTQTVNIFLVQDNELAPVARPLAPMPGPGALLNALLVGPTEPEKVAGYTSVATSAAFLDACVEEPVSDDGTVTVDLPPLQDPAEGQSSVTYLGFAQIVLTLTADSAVDGVRFVRDGSPVRVPRSDLNLSPEGQPVTAADYRSLVQEPS